jgi:hypothetical protein
MKGDLPQSTYMVFLISGAILSSLLLTSCASHQTYPSKWSALVPIKDNTCPDLSGRYAIAGEKIEIKKIEPPSYESEKTTYWGAIPVEKTDDKDIRLYLYEVFPQKYFISRGGITAATYAQIAQPDNDTLEISFINNQGLIDKQIYSVTKKEYSCSPKGISFPFSGGSGIGGIAGGMAGPVPFAAGIGNWGKYYLTKSVDGCLIIKEEGTAMAILFIIPVWKSYEVWHRFKEESFP